MKKDNIDKNLAYYDTEEFIRTWMKAYRLGESQTWVSRQLDRSPQGVSNKASRLRRIGIKLPDLLRKNATERGVDHEAWNHYIKAEMEKEETPE